MKKILLTISLLSLLTACKNEETSKLINISKTGSSNASLPHTNNSKPGTGFTPSVIPEKVETIKGIYQDKDSLYHLRYILEIGKTYSFNTKDVNKETLTFKDKSQSASQETYDLISFKVIDFKDGKYNLDVSMGGKKEITKAEGQQLILDTNGKKPSDPELAKMWKVKKAISHANFTMDMDIYGHVSNIKGMESIHNKAKTLLSPDLKGDELKGILNIIKQTLNPETFKVMFESSMIRFPEKGLKIGEKWNNDPSKKDQGYNQLTKVDANTTEIKIQGYIPTQSKKETDEYGITHILSIKGNQQGTIIINNNSGWVSKGTFTIVNTIKETAKKDNETQEIIKKIENHHYINH